jgi:hypothetical protein
MVYSACYRMRRLMKIPFGWKLYNGPKDWRLIKGAKFWDAAQLRWRKICGGAFATGDGPIIVKS